MYMQWQDGAQLLASQLRKTPPNRAYQTHLAPTTLDTASKYAPWHGKRSMDQSNNESNENHTQAKMQAVLWGYGGRGG